MAYNNTYGLQTINETIYNAGVAAYPQCASLITNCRDQAAKADPNDFGANAAVNEACMGADYFCSNVVESGYLNYSGKSYYDIAQNNPSPFPHEYYVGWLNSIEVQKAIGTPVNFSEYAPAVGQGFSCMSTLPLYYPNFRTL
jgi:hypothetical protein